MVLSPSRATAGGGKSRNRDPVEESWDRQAPDTLRLPLPMHKQHAAVLSSTRSASFFLTLSLAAFSRLHEGRLRQAQASQASALSRVQAAAAGRVASVISFCLTSFAGGRSLARTQRASTSDGPP